MRRLVILLLEGFRDDEVVVRVDGADLVRRPGATTSPLLGMAEEIRLDMPDSAERLVIALPGRGLEAAVPLTDGDVTVLADVEDDALHLRYGAGREGLI
jgi:hypothetical protein